MRNSQSGFTLIELVMVIVILGILAAFALPRFADLTSQARVASIQGIAGAIKSAAGIARAQQLANGSAANVSVTLDGTTIAMKGGAPTAAAIGTAIQFDGSGTSITETVSAPTTTYSAATNCTAVYTEAGGTTTVTTPFTVVLTTTGC